MLKRITILILMLSLTACAGDLRCRSAGPCAAYGDVQYMKLPDGWGGKYCSHDPQRC